MATNPITNLSVYEILRSEYEIMHIYIPLPLHIYAACKTPHPHVRQETNPLVVQPGASVPLYPYTGYDSELVLPTLHPQTV